MDFSKAFERVDRSLLIKIFKGLNLEEFSVRAIEKLFLDSKTVMGITCFFFSRLQKSARCETKLPSFRIFIHSFYRIPSSSNLHALDVSVKPSNLYQRGPSYWKLNDEVLENNARITRKNLLNFIENESTKKQKNLKHRF